MPAPRTFLLVFASLGGALASRAQQAPVVPLAPRQVSVQPPAPPQASRGVPVPSQTASATAKPAPQPTQPARVYRPVLLLGSRLIMGDNNLRDIDPNAMRAIHVYKGLDAPAKWRSLTTNGIIDITLKTRPKINSESLQALRRGLGLRKPVRFELDGVPLLDTSLRIATEAIAGIDISRPALGEAASTTINIRVVRLPPPPVLPGTIRIRGVAAY